MMRKGLGLEARGGGGWAGGLVSWVRGQENRGRETEGRPS